jgi:hypothetical protein
MALKASKLKHDIKYQCITPSVTGDFGCSEDCVFEKDIAAAVLTALNQQIALAGETRKMLEAKAEQLLPNIEKLRGEVARLQRLIEKTKTDKMELWEKYHTRAISAEP